MYKCYLYLPFVRLMKKCLHREVLKPFPFSSSFGPKGAYRGSSTQKCQQAEEPLCSVRIFNVALSTAMQYRSSLEMRSKAAGSLCVVLSYILNWFLLCLAGFGIQCTDVTIKCVPNVQGRSWRRVNNRIFIFFVGCSKFHSMLCDITVG